jgi:hypothetical protein
MPLCPAQFAVVSQRVSHLIAEAPRLGASLRQARMGRIDSSGYFGKRLHGRDLNWVAWKSEPTTMG